MELLTKVEQLEGKTIKSANEIYDGELISLIFTDGTCVVFEGYNHYGDIEVNIAKDVDDYTKVELGIMAKEKHERKLEIERKERSKSRKKRELAQLEKLKQKYEKQGE